MRTKSFISVILSIVILASSAAPAFAAEKFTLDLLTNDEFGKAISQFIKKNELSAVNKRVMGKTCGEVDFSQYDADKVFTAKDGRFMLTFDTAEEAQSCINSLSKKHNVLFAETDGIVKACANSEATSNTLSWGTETIQTDILADALKDVVFDDEVTVAVIDSGTAKINYLKDHIVKGYDYVDNDTDATNDTSSCSHGTFISSTVIDNMQGLPVNIMPIRVIEEDTAANSNIINGIYYAVDHGADVINMSLAGPSGYCESFDEAVDYAVSKKVSVVVSASNDSDNVMYYCPAHIPSAITVSAIKSDLEFDDSYSNYGAEIDFAAPGTNIKGYDSNGKKIYLTGTSMAAGFISACMGILRLLYPDASVAQLKSALADSAYNPLGVNKNRYYGYGIPQMMFFSGYLNGDVYLAPEKKDIVSGEAYTFTPYSLSDLSPVSDVQWSTSDAETAEIDSSGTLKALKAGKTEITATSGEKTAKCSVTVKEIKSISVLQEPMIIFYTYKYGQLDTTGIELQVNYTDGTSDDLSDRSKMEFEGFNPNVSGIQEISVTYCGAQAYYTVSVSYSFWQWLIRILLFGWLWY